jgi:hypothetical protein
MLALPRYGIRVSTNLHNCREESVCDWIEGTLLFSEERISSIDIIDILLEENVYQSQDFASEFVESIFNTINRRQNWLGDARTIEVDRRVMNRSKDWQSVPAHAFCLATALRELYPEWSQSLGNDFTVQGELFERIVEASFVRNGWEVYRTGWNSTAPPADFAETLLRISEQINDPALIGYLPPAVKDLGLDLICFRPFTDRRGGYPLYLVQCASGQHWERKLRTPSLDSWRDLIRFSAPHLRGIAIPFMVMSDDEFRSARLRSEGLFLDRYRVLSTGGQEDHWLLEPLRTEVINWLSPVINTLPEHELQ